MTKLKEIAYQLAQTMLLTMTIVIGYHGVKRFMEPAPNRVVGQDRLRGFPPVAIGGHVSSGGVQTNGRSHALVIVSSPSCQFCREAAPFHRTLIADASRQSVPIVVALPDATHDSRFASSVGLSQAKLVDWVSLGVKPLVTPMILLVDDSGQIVKYWQGVLRPEAESEVRRALTTPSALVNRPRKLPSGEVMLTNAEVLEVASRTAVVVLNTDERSAFEGIRYGVTAVNIPFDELRLRIKRELNPTVRHVVDCTFLEEVLCSQVMELLSREGFKVAAMDNSGAG